MRYEKGHKEQTRRRVVEVAAGRFRKHGIESSGVAELMADAGLTHGGFYAHFTSKDALIKTALGTALEATRSDLAEAVEAAEKGGGIEAIVRTYLLPLHRDHPERGCAAAALVGEIARTTRATRTEFTMQTEKLLDLIVAQLPTRLTKTVRRETAMAIYATMIGTLQLARAVTDPELSERLLDAGTSAAIELSKGVGR